jgi:hypothetical protein
VACADLLPALTYSPQIALPAVNELGREDLEREVIDRQMSSAFKGNLRIVSMTAR